MCVCWSLCLFTSTAAWRNVGFPRLMPSLCRVCLMQQDVVRNGEKSNFKCTPYRTASSAITFKQLPVGAEGNYSSESESEWKQWRRERLCLKLQHFLFTFCYIQFLSVRRFFFFFFFFFSCCMRFLLMDPNKLYLTWLCTDPWEILSLDVWIRHKWSSVFPKCGFLTIVVNMEYDNGTFKLYLT